MAETGKVRGGSPNQCPQGFHEGIDLPLSNGTRGNALGNGVVTDAGYGEGCWNRLSREGRTLAQADPIAFPFLYPRKKMVTPDGRIFGFRANDKSWIPISYSLP